MDMAPPTTIPSTPQPSQQPPKPPPNLANPLPLTATQESQVRTLYYAAVRAHCAPEIAAFAACARNRTVTVTWMCRAQRLAMNSCMVAHATVEEEDRAREEWFRSREGKKKERELESVRVEERRREVIELIQRQEEKEKEREKDRVQGVQRAEGEDGKEGREKEKGGGFWGSARR